MTALTPSAEARHVYSMMVNRADEYEDGLHLTLANSIELAVALRHKGVDSQAMTQIEELRAAHWIAPVEDGGWRVG